MGGRAKITLPNNIKIDFNNNTGYYEGEENGITYQLTYEQLNELKKFFHLVRTGYEPRILTWYNSLSRWDKKKVKRQGGPREPDDSGFYPDE